MSLAARARSIKPSLIRGLRDRARPTSLDLGLGQTDLPVAPEAVSAIMDKLHEDPRAPYCPNLGMAHMREAVGRRYGCDPASVMITSGVQEALAVALLGLISPGDEVLIPEPAFPAYPNLVRMAQGVPVSVPLDPDDHWRLHADVVAQAITPRTRAILLNSPSNPTGAVMSKDDLQAVLQVCAQHDVAWISDEIYEDYVYDEHTHHSPVDFPEHRDLGLRLSGMSKSHHMMGWRLGWMTGPPEVIEQLKPLHQHLVTSASTMSQRGASAALAHHERVVSHALEVFEGRRAIAEQGASQLPHVRFWGGQGAFYLFLDARAYMPTLGSSMALALHILDDVDVITIPGEGFGVGGQGHLRLAYTTSNQALATAMDRLIDCFERLSV